MNEEPPPRCLDINVVATIADDPQRVTLAKGVNDTLNTYIAITDSKAVAFLGGTTAAASFFLSKPVDGLIPTICFAASAIAYVAGAVAAASVIFPRIPERGRGAVFWGDIVACGNADTYANTFERACASGGLLADYARLNYCTSIILRCKVRRLRIAMLLSLTGLAISLSFYIVSGLK